MRAGARAGVVVLGALVAAQRCRDAIVVLADGSDAELASRRKQLGVVAVAPPVGVHEHPHEVVLVDPVARALQGVGAGGQVQGGRDRDRGLDLSRQAVPAAAEGEEGQVRAEREAHHRHTRDEMSDRLQNAEEIAIEAGVVDPRAQRLAVTRAPHVHAHDVPAAGEGQQPRRHHVGGGVRAAEAVDHDERGSGLSGPRLPGGAQQQVGVVVGAHHDVFRWMAPSQMPPHEVGQEGLAVASCQEGVGAEQAVGGRTRFGAHEIGGAADGGYNRGRLLQR